MKYLVTGGAGFIGSHLVEELARLPGAGVIAAFDNLSSGTEANLEGFRGQVELIRGDIRELSALKAAFKGVKVVFHHAAFTSVPGSVNDPATCTDINVTGTLNVLQAAKDAGVKRVVFASSSAVYGENPVSPKNESLAIDPLSPYAASKYTGEMYCRIFARLHGIETVCFRYFNVFGPRQDPNSQYAAVIPKFMEAVKAGRAPRVFGDGEQTRDFVFVKDIAQANILAAEAPLPGPVVLNVGTGKALSLNLLLAHFTRILGRDMNAQYTDAAPGDIKHSLADISQITRVLSYVPRVSIEEGLRQTFKAFGLAAPLD